MGYNPIKIQASNKIDFRLLIFVKTRWLISGIHYLCIWLEATLAKTFEKKKKKRYAYLVVGNLGNSQLVHKDGIVVLTL